MKKSEVIGMFDLRIQQGQVNTENLVSKKQDKGRNSQTCRQ